MRRLLTIGLGLFLLSTGLQAVETDSQFNVNSLHQTRRHSHHESDSSELEGPPGPIGLPGAIGPTGATGSNGPTGATGANGILMTNYAGSNDRDIEAFQSVVATRAIGFTANQVTPVGIIHNTNEGINDSLFVILNEGLYSIGWVVTLKNAVIGLTNTASIYLVYTLDSQLFNFDGTLFDANTTPPLQQQLLPPAITSVFDGLPETVSGRILTFLPANATLQLLIGAERSQTLLGVTRGIFVDFPRLSITQRRNL